MSIRPPHLVYLGWERPAIDLIAERLLRLNDENPEQFRRATIVVPTRESSRSLRETLAEHSRRRALLIPRIILPAELLPLEPATTATPIEEYTAWFSELDPDHINRLYPTLFPTAPADELRQDWRLTLTQHMQQLRFRLDNFLLTPQTIKQQLQGPLAQPLGSIAEEERNRWDDLEHLFARVDERLHQQNKLTRREAINRALNTLTWPAPTQQIILACLPQLPPFLQQTVSRLQQQSNGNIESWVHAPEEHKHRFTPFGQPNETWAQGIIPLEENQIHVETNDSKLAQKATHLVADIIRHNQTVVLGACDPRYTPALKQAFSEQGWTLYNPSGRSLSTTQLGMLPEQLQEAARPPQSATALDTLLRNPVLQHLYNLPNPEQSCRQLDHIAQVHFPASADSLQTFCERLQQQTGTYTHTLSYLLRVRELLHRLADSSTRPAALSELADQLIAHYPGQDSYSHSARTLARLLHDMAENLAAHPEQLDFTAALRLISLLFNSGSIQERPRHDCALDALGWLELPYTTSEHLILTGMHHGSVPESGPINPILPDTLCHALGLENTTSQLARDSFLLQSLLASHRDTQIIIARQTPDQDPQLPSPLLLRCKPYPSTELPTRIQRLFISTDTPQQSPPYARGEWYLRHPGHKPAAPGGSTPPAAASPRPQESIELLAQATDNPWADPRNPLSPSVLSRFLTCPLRFWLKYALRLDPQEAYEEHKGAADIRESGTLLHAVICQLTEQYSTWQPGLTSDAIAAAAQAHLQTLLQQTYSDDRPITTYTLQRLLEEKLRAFARHHLEDLRQGWSIIAREHSTRWEAAPGLLLNMIIDRVDRHTDGRIRVIDYKSSATAPAQRHLEPLSDPATYQHLIADIPLWENQRWRDVQLPLYAAYAQEHWASPLPAEIAYYNIPLSSKPVAYSPWDLPPEARESALQAAKAAAAHIRAGNCLIPAEAFGGSAYADFGGLAPESDPRSMLDLPALN